MLFLIFMLYFGGLTTFGMRGQRDPGKARRTLSGSNIDVEFHRASKKNLSRSVASFYLTACRVFLVIPLSSELGGQQALNPNQEGYSLRNTEYCSLARCVLSAAQDAHA